ncbi:recombinase family protein [Curtobacterium sp. Leaf261]|uniref:recombinase family protein n=1 Tax=Curtobacterium sp. Leaf261 TaxID=1736311 RepID=UPI002E10BF67
MQPQIDALVDVGVDRRDICGDVTSGRKEVASRPGMGSLLGYAEAGDTVVAWRVDRLGRPLMDVLTTVAMLGGAGYRSPVHVKRY